MKISELPEEIKSKALLNQKIYGKNLDTDFLQGAFIWKDTNEGHLFWKKLRNKQPNK